MSPFAEITPTPSSATNESSALVPELPEVEVVRGGLDPYVRDRTVNSVRVAYPRSLRRHAAGVRGFEREMSGSRIRHVSRRGKYLWFVLDDGARDRALVAHLGMSGQLLLIDPDDVPERVRLHHVRVVFDFQAVDHRTIRQMWFVDQRTFGGLYIDELVDDDADGAVPESIKHIARDPLDPLFDDEGFVRRVRRVDRGIKRILLDQNVISGIGNIYADEALWRTRVHYERPGSSLSTATVTALLKDVRDVMSEALAQGGTSFDDLYVNVNGESGYFDRALQAYGRAGDPCDRCGRTIVREQFMNRSSFRCPRCQRRPAARRSRA